MFLGAQCRTGRGSPGGPGGPEEREGPREYGGRQGPGKGLRSDLAAPLLRRPRPEEGPTRDAQDRLPPLPHWHSRGGQDAALNPPGTIGVLVSTPGCGDGGPPKTRVGPGVPGTAKGGVGRLVGRSRRAQTRP